MVPAVAAVASSFIHFGRLIADDLWVHGACVGGGGPLRGAHVHLRDEGKRLVGRRGEVGRASLSFCCHVRVRPEHVELIREGELGRLVGR